MAQPAASVGAMVWVSSAAPGLDERLATQMDRLGLQREGGAERLAEAEVVAWLAGADADRLARERRSALEGFAETLAAATSCRHLVLLSSAMVYGAWSNNPVPLTEDQILRPAGDFILARQLAALEQIADNWRVARPGRSVTILRPVTAMAAGASGGLSSALAAGMGRRLGEEDPPAQFLHLDDLAAAVALAAGRRLDGVYNVAPDGWVEGARVRALAGSVPRVRLPDWMNQAMISLRWRFTRGPIPPGLAAYTKFPWLVANDRLRAAGWVPTVTNEQTYVEGTEQKWWTVISPKRRQEITLGVSVVIGLAAVAGAIGGFRRQRRRALARQSEAQ